MLIFCICLIVIPIVIIISNNAKREASEKAKAEQEAREHEAYLNSDEYKNRQTLYTIVNDPETVARINSFNNSESIRDSRILSANEEYFRPYPVLSRVFYNRISDKYINFRKYYEAKAAELTVKEFDSIKNDIDKYYQEILKDITKWENDRDYTRQSLKYPWEQ